jgi:hypothetical protein
LMIVFLVYFFKNLTNYYKPSYEMMIVKKTKKQSHKGRPPQTVVRGGVPANRRWSLYE